MDGGHYVAAAAATHCAPAALCLSVNISAPLAGAPAGERASAEAAIRLSVCLSVCLSFQANFKREPGFVCRLVTTPSKNGASHFCCRRRCPAAPPLENKLEKILDICKKFARKRFAQFRMSLFASLKIITILLARSLGQPA